MSIAPSCSPQLAALATALLSDDPAHRPGSAHVLSLLDRAGAGPQATSSVDPSRDMKSSFVGRQNELRHLGEALDTMKRGVVTAVTIEGPSGIGKTRLVEHFLKQSAPEEGLLLRSRCYPYEVVPFEAVDEAVDELSRFLVGLDAERIEALMPRDTPALRTIFPVLARVQLAARRAASSPNAAPHEVRRQGFQALRELIGRVAFGSSPPA